MSFQGLPGVYQRVSFMDQNVSIPENYGSKNMTSALCRFVWLELVALFEEGAEKTWKNTIICKIHVSIRIKSCSVSQMLVDPAMAAAMFAAYQVVALWNSWKWPSFGLSSTLPRNGQRGRRGSWMRKRWRFRHFQQSCEDSQKAFGRHRDFPRFHRRGKQVATEFEMRGEFWSIQSLYPRSALFAAH